MKMENEIHAPISGIVKGIYAQPGENITPDEVIVRIEPA